MSTPEPLNVLWLQSGGCGGCSMSLLCADTPDFAALLRDTGTRYCLGLHPKLPPLTEQLPLLRALWPGPLVVRWNLNRLHGAFGYEAAEKKYGEFTDMLDPDPETRGELARVIRATAGAGQDGAR